MAYLCVAFTIFAIAALYFLLQIRDLLVTLIRKK